MTGWLPPRDYLAVRAAVAAQWGITCGWCGQPVDLQAPAKLPTGRANPAAPHLDHVIPRSQGGPNTLANLRLTHARCNEQRGARPLSAGPAQTGGPAGRPVTHHRDARFF